MHLAGFFPALPFRDSGPLLSRLRCLLIFATCFCATVHPADAQTNPPVITAQPTRLDLGASDAVVLRLAASADATQFQWYSGNPGDTSLPIAGATGALLVLPPPTTATSVFWARVSNSAGSVDSEGLTVLKSTAPSNLMLFAAGSASNGQLGLGFINTIPHPWPAQIKTGTGVAQISAGSAHTLFLKTDGSLWAMGSNAAGQLGDGSTTDRYNPVLIASGVTQISAGGEHSLFIKSDGSLWGMGRTVYGQLGLGATITPRSTPVQIATGVVRISAGYSHSLFIKSDGTLWGMGSNNYGQLGDGSGIGRSTPVQIATGVSLISADSDHSYFVTANGAFWSTEREIVVSAASPDDIQYFYPPPSIRALDVVQISASIDGYEAYGGYNYGAGRCLFRKSDNSLWSLSFFESGTAQIAADITGVSAGSAFALFRKSDNSLWSMGYNSSGQLGDGSTTDRTTPVLVARNVAAFSAGYRHSLYASTDYTVTFRLGALGAPDGGGELVQTVAPSTAAVPPVVVSTNVDYEFNGWDTSFTAVTANLTITAQYRDAAVIPSGIAAQPAAITANADEGPVLWVKASGNHLTYQWYRGAPGDVSDALIGATGPLLVLPPLGQTSTFWVRVSNTLGSVNSEGIVIPVPAVAPVTLFGVGSSKEGQLGSIDNLSHPDPLSIVTGVTQISSGSYHSLFIKTSGSLWAMGANDRGQLGDGTTANRASPYQVATNVAHMSAGGSHSLFIKSDGSLWAMGSNDYGQLGDGSNFNRSTPVQVATNVAQISAGVAHSLFIKFDGSLWAMGSNYNGRLGDGSTVARSVPVPIATGVIRISAGAGHSLFIKSDGSLWAMGYNYFGQLGDGSFIDRTTPVRIATDVAQVSASGSHSLFIKSDGSLWAVGMSEGPNGTVWQSTPAQIASDVTQVSAGAYHSLFIKSDGSLWAFGRNGYGQLGDGSLTTRVNPVQIATKVTHISSGGDHSLFAARTYTVTFDLGIQGTRTGGGALLQNVLDGSNATAPAVTGLDGWDLAGWDADFSSVTDNLVIKAIYKVADIITFPSLPGRIFGDAPILLEASTHSGLPVSFAVLSGPATLGSDGRTLTLSGVGSVTIRASQPGTADIPAAHPVDRTFTVSQAVQAITFAPLSDRIFGDAPLPLSASASSGLPVTFSVVSGPASLGADGFTLTLTGAGSVTVRAAQTGSANYAAATAVNRTFSVGQATQTIAFAALANLTFGAAPFALSASASSGLPVTFSIVSGPASLGSDGRTVTLTAPGSVTLRATQEGDANFASATPVDRSFSVSQTPQTIDFVAIPERVFGDAPFALNATASSGLPVAFSIVSGPATLGSDGHTLTLTGGGPVNVRAAQPGDDNFAPALSVEQTFVVNRATQTITFAALSARTFGDAPVLLAASASSGLPVSFSIVSGPASLDGHTLTFSGAGSVTVRAAQAGNANFSPAIPVDRTFSVFPSPTATLTLPALTAVTYDGMPHALLAATTPAGLHVVYAYKSGSAPATETPPALPGSYTVTATLDDSLRTTAQPRPAVGKLNIHPAAPGLPATLARTVAGTVDLHLTGANPPAGIVYQAKGLPSGLRLDAQTGRLNGVLTARPGSYSFSVWALAGSLKSETSACTLTVGAFPLPWIGSFEGLIRSSSSDELPVGKLQLTTTATGAFTGRLITPQPKTFAIKGTWRVTPDGQSAAATVTAGTYLLTLATTADAITGELSQGTTAASALLLGRLMDPVRLAAFTGTGTSLAPWRGSYAATATTEAGLNLDSAEPPRPLPGGTGTATLTVAAKGTLAVKGKLADGSPWTASLAPDAGGGYRWFTQPYATPGNYFAGETRFTPLADFPARYQIGPDTADFLWHKPASPNDKLFPAGFGPVVASVAATPAKAPFAGKFTVAFNGSEHLGNGLQVATDIKTSARSFALTQTAAETYTLAYTKPAPLTVPLALTGDTLHTTARPTVLATASLLDLLILSDGTNQACVQIGQASGNPSDLSVQVACWTGATAKLTPELLAGSYSLHGHSDSDVQDTADGFSPVENSLTIAPAGAGRVRITLPGLGEFFAVLSGPAATAVDLPQTLGSGRLHAFKLVSDGQGRLALYLVATELADPTLVSVSVLTGGRD